MFDALSIQYFGKKLPKIPVHFDRIANETIGAFYSCENKSITISNSDFAGYQRDPQECRATMLHEMAHYYVELNFPNSQEALPFSYGHGEHWKAEMRHLAALGAFDSKLWSLLDLP